MKFRDRRTKHPVEWEYRLYLDGNTWAKFITAGYQHRSQAVQEGKSFARYLLLTGQADEIEICVDKMLPARIPSCFRLFGFLTRDSIRR